MSEAQSRFRIGVDIGQKSDHSACCVVEEKQNKAVVRFIWKYPLGTPFNILADTVTELFHSVSKQGQVWSLAVDATGMGTHPAKMIQERLPEIRVDYHIFNNKNKREMVGKVKVMHSLGRLTFARKKGDDVYNRMLAELINEMKAVQAKVIREDDESPEVEVFKTGSHDDLFTALALAIKDIDLREMGGGGPSAIFLKDNSWTKTPLDERGNAPPIAFF